MPRRHCQPHRHRLRGRGFGRFHPYMMMHPYHHLAAAAGLFFDDQNGGEDISSFMKGKARITEEPSSGNNTDDGVKNHFVIEMAIPGVQPNHITIEEKQGELEIVAIRLDSNEEVVKTYQDVLFLHPSKADFANLIATTKNGILTIRIPKKFQQQVMNIETESALPPPRPTKKSEKVDQEGVDDTDMDQDAPEETQEEDFYVSWDLPGFSASDVVVEFHNDRDENQLQVTAQKKQNARGSDNNGDDEGNMITMSVRRFMTVPPSIDMTQAHAYLQHGVFTLMAPSTARHQEEGNGKNGTVRTFYATPEEDAILPEVATLQINGKEDVEKTPPSPMVETVNHEWETIDGNELSDKVTGDADSNQKPEAK